MDNVQWEYLIEVDESALSFSTKVKVNGVKYDGEIDYLKERGQQGWELVQAPTHGFSAFYKQYGKPYVMVKTY